MGNFYDVFYVTILRKIRPRLEENPNREIEITTEDMSIDIVLIQRAHKRWTKISGINDVDEIGALARAHNRGMGSGAASCDRNVVQSTV